GCHQVDCRADQTAGRCSAATSLAAVDRFASLERNAVPHTASFSLTHPNQIVIRKIGKNLPGTTFDSSSPTFSATSVG
ncbi:hypothetical protein, partial [Burkholderia pyrrocinia]|uniref:hypothetical protein n=1 Tax=Burkholderia pyrrocinia TaxID=60550 RepID=UPI002AB2F2D3